jgi:thiol-disulfide isomerase/thioredoxin
MLQNIFRSVSQYIPQINNTKYYILLLLLVIGFIGIAYYTYISYVLPKLNPSYVENKELQEETASNEAELYLFYTEWCPYCKKAKPYWDKLKTNYENKPINNTIVYFREVDCEKNEQLADQYDVKGYPTIKLVKNGQVIEYDAKVEYQTLVEFLHTTL